ncbi:MAG TPA: PTS sugar transporter subunit IIA [Verrucomicrobiae bacterium]|nr:PTS sugar transporter subunit IIA [Verrucomicrobiae bacterium]
MASISELLRPEQIQLTLRGGDKSSVLRELVELAPELRDEPAQREVFLNSLLEREKLHTTAIGDGIALPHTRNPLGGLLKRSLIVFGRHAQGIPFAALDNKPVQLFFLIASTNLTEHLGVLARISRVLRDAKLRNELISAALPAQVISSIRETEQRLVK